MEQDILDNTDLVTLGSHTYLETDIITKCTPYSERELYQQFDELLDETTPPFKVGTQSYLASKVFIEVAPLDYDIAFLEWLDNEIKNQELAHVNGEYYSVDEIKQHCAIVGA